MEEYSNVSDAKHSVFNNELTIRSTRHQIECAFGQLKAWWRIINGPIDVELEFGVSRMFCCVLHNLFEKHNIELNCDVVAAQISLDQGCQNCQHHYTINQLYVYNSAQSVFV